MLKLPDTIENLRSSLQRLPGVGQKTAMRYVMSMLNWQDEDVHTMKSLIESVKEISFCEDCGVFSDEIKCEICISETRNKELCIVETVVDLLAIDASDQFKGKFHVLGGVLNPLMGIGPEELRIKELELRIKNEEFSSIILALNPSVEGDATCSFIKELLPNGTKVERIGFGIPIGGNLEYLDPLTISKALENRRCV